MDQGVTLTRTGTRYGPRAIREASLFYRAVREGAVERTAVHVDTKVAQRLKERPDIVDIGDFTIFPQDIMKTTESISTGVAEIVERGGLPVVLGGDVLTDIGIWIAGGSAGRAGRRPLSQLSGRRDKCGSRLATLAQGGSSPPS